MIAGRQTTERRFAIDFLLACTVVVACVVGLTFVDSSVGRGWFSHEATAQKLPESASIGEFPFILTGTGQQDQLRLGSVDLEPGKTYLLTVDLTAGRSIQIVGRSQPGGGRRAPASVVWRCPPSPSAMECQFVFNAAELPAKLHLAAAHLAEGERGLRGVTLVELSAVFSWTSPVLSTLLWLTPLSFFILHGGRCLRGLSHPEPTDEIVQAGALFGLCLIVFHAGPVQQVNDSRYLTAVSHSVIHGNGPVIPESFAGEIASSRQRKNRGYQLDRVGDRILHHYSPIPAILDAPIVAAFEFIGVTPARPGGYWDRKTEIRVMRFSAALASALLCVVLFRTARGFLGPLASLGLTLSFAFGTQILSTLSRPYWAHTWGQLLSAAAIHLVVLPWRGRERLSVAVAATLASLAFYCRPQTFWTALGLVFILALSRRWRSLAVFGAVGGLWLATGILASMSFYGSALPRYFFAAQVSMGRLGAGRAGSYRYLTASLGALLSPSRGLFIYAPIYLWVLWQVVLGWRRLPSRILAAVSLAVVAGHLWLLVHTGVWPGGASYGARQFSDVLVWLFLLAVMALAALRSRWPAMTRPNRRLQVAFGTALLAMSLFVNARGAYSRATWTWRSYDRPPAWLTEGRQPLMPQPEYWNWRHPQFLAGLLTPDQSAEDSNGANEMR